MSASRDVVSAVERMLKNEEKESELFLDLMTETDNLVAKQLLRRIMLDSLMHQEIMTTIISYFKGELSHQGKVAGTRDQFSRLAREEGEVKAIASELLHEIRDEGVRLLLRFLVLDEEKHQKILLHLIRMDRFLSPKPDNPSGGSISLQINEVEGPLSIRNSSATVATERRRS